MGDQGSCRLGSEDRPVVSGVDSQADAGASHEKPKLPAAVKIGPAADRGSLEEELEVVEKQLKAVGEICKIHWQVLLSLARHELARHRVPPAEYSDDDAVQSSMRTVLEQIVAGKIDEVADDSGALRIVRRLILEKVINRSVHMHAIKRDRTRSWSDQGDRSGVDQETTDSEDEDRERNAETLDLKKWLPMWRNSSSIFA